MERLDKLRTFVSQRLNAAVEDIMAAFEKTVVKYEEEAAVCQEVISRQHALLLALHKPLNEIPSIDAFTQQLLPSPRPGPPEDQDLDEAEIIQFTYSTKSGAPGPGPGPGCGPAFPHLDVQLVSSDETEDSEDYGQGPAGPASAPKQRSKRVRRSGGGACCQVCGRSFRGHRYLLKHASVHLEEAEPVCGLCGERFSTVEALRGHIWTHRKTQTRTPGRETRTLNKTPDRETRTLNKTPDRETRTLNKTPDRETRTLNKTPGRLPRVQLTDCGQELPQDSRKRRGCAPRRWSQKRLKGSSEG
ncbi:uncharacterized protein V6R79_011207 [Siganus canaliculatus]